MSGTRRGDSLARPGEPLAWRQTSLACKRRRWESNPLGAALQAAAVPSGSSVIFLERPRQESNLVYNLRGVACESGTLRGQFEIKDRADDWIRTSMNRLTKPAPFSVAPRRQMERRQARTRGFEPRRPVL